MVRSGDGLTGDIEPELRFMETESSKLRVGELVLRDDLFVKFSEAERQMEGEYSFRVQGVVNINLLPVQLVTGVLASGGDASLIESLLIDWLCNVITIGFSVLVVI